MIDAELVPLIQAAILNWYENNKRDLPWRHSADPYAVWISEIMLQQTTVTAVIPFYTRWMARFPTSDALAEAPIDDVLQVWAGLGYYARARNLHRAAIIIKEQLGGVFPSTAEEWKRLPGIGEYTSAAIASIAFGQDIAALDANVTRVISRLGTIPGDPVRETASRRAIGDLAALVLPKGSASEFNQALMDLGSRICLSERAECLSCPVMDYCGALKSGRPTDFPAIVRPAKVEGVRHVSVAIWDSSGNILLVQRPHSDPLWGGLWELPRVAADKSETLEAAALRAAALFPGVRTGTPTQFGAVKHVVGNSKITLHGYSAPLKPGVIRESMRSAAWASPSSLEAFALATPQKKLIAQYISRRLQPALDVEEIT